MSSYLPEFTCKKRRIRQNPGRLVRRVLLVLLPLLLLSGVFAIWQLAADSGVELPVYVVQPGDSLWTIARAHAPLQMDVRLYIQRLRKLNQLPHSVLQIGQTLTLPGR